MDHVIFENNSSCVSCIVQIVISGSVFSFTDFVNDLKSTQFLIFKPIPCLTQKFCTQGKNNRRIPNKYKMLFHLKNQKLNDTTHNNLLHL